MKKLITLLTLLLCVVVSSWALTGTEKATNTGTKNTDLTGTSYTIAGTYIAGAGGSKAGDMPNNGVKVRTNQNSNTLEFTVNSGYTITSFYLDAVANDDGSIDATSVTVDNDATKGHVYYEW